MSEYEELKKRREPMLAVSAVEFNNDVVDKESILRNNYVDTTPRTELESKLDDIEQVELGKGRNSAKFVRDSIYLGGETVEDAKIKILSDGRIFYNKDGEEKELTI